MPVRRPRVVLSGGARGAEGAALVRSLAPSKAASSPLALVS